MQISILIQISNYSCSIVKPNFISRIYKDLNQGKLGNVVNTQKQNSDIMQAILLTLWKYRKMETHRNQIIRS